MAQVYTFTDSNGEVRLMAEINPAPGGPPPVITRELFETGDTPIATGASGSLPWDGNAGDALLDLTDPAAPTIVDAGVYAVSGFVYADSATTVGGAFGARLELDVFGADVSARAFAVKAASQSQFGVQIPLNATYYIPAGGTILVSVFNDDGVLTVQFAMNMYVQRLS